MVEEMAKSVKLADIAKEVGVSVVTVSKALSGQKGVSDQMREKIVRLADELGYQQSSASEKDTAHKGRKIGILIHEKHFSKYNSFYLQMYQTLMAELAAQGDFGMLEVMTHEMENRLVTAKLLRESEIDAVILLGEFSKEYCNLVKAKVNVPVIYLDFCDERQEVISVISDSFYGSYYLTNYLLERGHKDIAFVGSLLATTSITDRYLGYVKAMMEHGQTVRPDWQIEDRDKETGLILEPEKLALPLELPTAFVCDCDLTAGVLIKRLEKEGYTIPQDFSVVGYDNFIFPGVCDVEITTYEVDIHKMVSTTVKLMGKAINKETHQMGIHIVSGHLVEKESVKALSEG